MLILILKIKIKYILYIKIVTIGVFATILSKVAIVYEEMEKK